LEPQSLLSPGEAYIILKAWENEETPLVITTAFPALAVSGAVRVSRSDAIELCSVDGGIIFTFCLSDRSLRLYGSWERLVLDVAGELPARLILTPLT
jgi:hypothetical protein